MKRLWRCVPCLLFVASLACAAFAVHAQSPGPLTQVSSDGLVALVGALLLAVLTGYTKGVDRRVTALEVTQAGFAPVGRLNVLEHEHNQLASVVYNQPVGFQEKHPTRIEFSEFRADIRDRFDRLERLVRERRNG